MDHHPCIFGPVQEKSEENFPQDKVCDLDSEFFVEELEMIVHDAKRFSSYIGVIALNNHLDACEQKWIVEGSRNFFTQFFLYIVMTYNKIKVFFLKIKQKNL